MQRAVELEQCSSFPVRLTSLPLAALLVIALQQSTSLCAASLLPFRTPYKALAQCGVETIL